MKQQSKPQRNPLKFLVFAVLMLAVVYIAETNSLSTQGYEVTELQKELVRAREERTELNMELAQSSSIYGLQNIESVAGMEQSDFRHLGDDGTLVRR